MDNRNKFAENGKERDLHRISNSRKSVRWSAVPVAPMRVFVGVRWLEGQWPQKDG